MRARDPQALYQWYEKHLGLPGGGGTFVLPAESQRASIAVGFFPQTATYFPASQPAMLNFQVDDLDALLDTLKSAGVDVDPKGESSGFGNFGWFTDPEGNRVELWEPPDPPASGISSS